MTRPAARVAGHGRAGIAESPLGVAALLTGAASAIHVKAAIEHGSHWWGYGAFFGALAALQMVWAVGLARGGGGRPLLTAVLLGSLATAGIWIVARTTGVPVGPWAWQPEPVGTADLTATVDEVLTAALAAAAAQPGGWAARRLSWVAGAQATRLASMLLCASLLSLALGGHSHA